MYNVQNHSPADQGLQILGHRALRCDPKLIFWEAPNAREVASHLWLPHVEGNQSIFYWTAPVKTRHNSTTQCKDLFDNEASEEEMRVEAGKQLGKKSTELSREERQMNLAAKSWLPLRRWWDAWIPCPWGSRRGRRWPSLPPSPFPVRRPRWPMITDHVDGGGQGETCPIGGACGRQGGILRDASHSRYWDEMYFDRWTKICVSSFQFHVGKGFWKNKKCEKV